MTEASTSTPTYRATLAGGPHDRRVVELEELTPVLIVEGVEYVLSVDDDGVPNRWVTGFSYSWRRPWRDPDADPPMRRAP